jgi:hypothetical protein
VERRLREHREGLTARDRRRQLPAQNLVHDESGVVAGDVELAEQRGVAGDVDRDLAVREHRVDLAAVRLGVDAVDIGGEQLAESVAGVVDDRDDDGSAVAESGVFLANGRWRDAHRGTTPATGIAFGKSFITQGVYCETSGFSLAVPARYIRTVLPLCLPRHGRSFGDVPRIGQQSGPTATAIYTRGEL